MYATVARHLTTTCGKALSDIIYLVSESISKRRRCFSWLNVAARVVAKAVKAAANNSAKFLQFWRKNSPLVWLVSRDNQWLNVIASLL